MQPAKAGVDPFDAFFYAIESVAGNHLNSSSFRSGAKLEWGEEFREESN
ncbi:hypothetical protein [Brevibacillus brevis]|uniref:Uncharacterized protein n=1 Tax=Brevibacillus brevis TaxID=1393 RepID=A0ABY9T9R0_BREBE|nr:hypothetical protein [Brevibacillus brevis]WNC15657.1 hypothetical protein RGB73_04770 [Brevibacillus brevis]